MLYIFCTFTGPGHTSILKLLFFFSEAQNLALFRNQAEIKQRIWIQTTAFYDFVHLSYEELRGHVDGRRVAEVRLVMERIIKCNHPSLAEGNKASQPYTDGEAGIVVFR